MKKFKIIIDADIQGTYSAENRKEALEIAQQVATEIYERLGEDYTISVRSVEEVSN